MAGGGQRSEERVATEAKCRESITSSPHPNIFSYFHTDKDTNSMNISNGVSASVPDIDKDQ